MGESGQGQSKSKTVKECLNGLTDFQPEVCNQTVKTKTKKPKSENSDDRQIAKKIKKKHAWKNLLSQKEEKERATDDKESKRTQSNRKNTKKNKPQNNIKRQKTTEKRNKKTTQKTRENRRWAMIRTAKRSRSGPNGVCNQLMVKDAFDCEPKELVQKTYCKVSKTTDRRRK